MKSQKLFALALSCLLFMETPFTSTAAPLVSASEAVTADTSSLSGTQSLTLTSDRKASGLFPEIK